MRIFPRPLTPGVASGGLAAPRDSGAGPSFRLGSLRLLALAVLLLAAIPAQAQIGDTTYRLRDATQEQRAREIGKELRCLVCQNQSIEDSDASLARDLRRIVREQVEQGASNEQVLRFVHERYGDFVLLRPPFNAATLLLWATPALALLGGLFAIWRARRRADAAGIGPLELTEAERKRLAALQGDPRA
jgi:cytochrome c-type biogenesis protein CcmH